MSETQRCLLCFWPWKWALSFMNQHPRTQRGHRCKLQSPRLGPDLLFLCPCPHPTRILTLTQTHMLVPLPVTAPPAQGHCENKMKFYTKCGTALSCFLPPTLTRLILYVLTLLWPLVGIPCPQLVCRRLAAPFSQIILLFFTGKRLPR